MLSKKIDSKLGKITPKNEKLTKKKKQNQILWSLGNVSEQIEILF